MGKSKAPYRKFILFQIVMADRLYQPVIAAYREEVDAKALFSLDIGKSMCVLI